MITPVVTSNIHLSLVYAALLLLLVSVGLIETSRTERRKLPLYALAWVGIASIIALAHIIIYP